MRKALLIAFHFPPVEVSSGLQRTLSLSTDLPQNGFDPVVLTVHPRAYIKTTPGQLRDIPDGCNVIRAFALDTARHLSLKGKYPAVLALPDRWVTWWLGGVISGLFAIAKSKPSVIWSTYPIATAHLIGLTLNRLTGIAWVADFRDSMTEPDYPRQALQRKVFKWIERKTMIHCRRAVFTTPGAARMYRDRYPELQESKCVVIENGYNDTIFSEVESELAANLDSHEAQKLSLIHSGVVYPSERDPRPLFEAIARLKAKDVINKNNLTIIMRATGHDELFQPEIEALGIADIIQLEPSIPYREALREMLLASGLLILQADNCNHQIPAKLYEYFRARRPILALTDSEGDTAMTMTKAGLNTIASLSDSADIESRLVEFIRMIRSKSAPIASEEAIGEYRRQKAANRLAKLFDTVLEEKSGS